jgi:hypothetical protein
LGLLGGKNLYAYTGQDPNRLIDSLGLVPGDPFPTRGGAAQDALNFINPTSIAQNQEYIGLIYLNPNNGMYYATSPLANGCQGSANKPISFPKATVPVGDYHTHGDYCDAKCNRTSKAGDQNNSDNFSSPDIADGKSKAGPFKGFPGWMKYLGTPSGQMKQYTPGSSPQPLDPTR